MLKESSDNSLFNNPLIRFVSDNKYRWLRHTLFFILGLILAFKGDWGANDSRSEKVMDATLLVDLLNFLFIMSMIYLLLLVFIPKLLFRSKVFLFFVSFICINTLIYFFVWFTDFYFLNPLIPERIYHIELSFLDFIQLAAVCSVLLGAVVGLKVFKKWITDVQQMNELQQNNLKAELEQLKSQVNPHFLFNTLNNLLVLTKTDPEKATQVLHGLSDLLRYQLYDSSREKISLSKDIAFLQNYLSLEKIRKNDFDFTIQTEGKTDNLSLPPFLFIPFVENAVKHGASTVGHSYLTINFSIKDKQLHFQSINSKPPVKPKTIGGLGLINIKRRLELLYPGNHTLQITDNTDQFIVNLIIPI
ncbi:MAG: histidine kinase [Ferruginibacter sp.]